jgi:hypothetical protein
MTLAVAASVYQDVLVKNMFGLARTVEKRPDQKCWECTRDLDWLTNWCAKLETKMEHFFI